MKSLDKRLSTVLSPFDETGKTQSEVTAEQYLEYRKDSLVNAIGKKQGYQDWDLHFEDLVDELELDEMKLLLSDCLIVLNSIYPIDVVYDYIMQYNLLENDYEQIIKLIKFFVYDEWLDQIPLYLPIIPISDLLSTKLVEKEIKDSYSMTNEKILKDEDIHPLIRYHFDYCPSSEGVKTLLIWFFKDMTGVISRQLTLTQKR
jgi:hypothetical protein